MQSALLSSLSALTSTASPTPSPTPSPSDSELTHLTAAQVNSAVTTFNSTLLQVAIAVGVGLVIWLVATFLIRQVVRRILAGTQLTKRRLFRWAAPALRALDSERRAQRAKTIGSLLNSVVAVVITTIVFIYVLKAFGVDIAPLLTSVGILGVAVAFGAQQLIRDFLAGIFLTLEDQFGIGDVIELGAGEVVGTVESVGLRITRVRAEDGAIWYLRNGEILRVGNRSQGPYIPKAPAMASSGVAASCSDSGPKTDAAHKPDAQGQRAGE